MSGGAAPRREGSDPAEPAMLDLTGWRPGPPGSASRPEPDDRGPRSLDRDRVSGPRFVLHRGGRVRRRR